MRIKSEALDFSNDGLALYLSLPFTGLVESHSDTGELLSIAEYAEGILHGYSCDYYDNQCVAREGFYCQGQSHGVYSFFDELGVLVERHYYDHAVLIERHLISSDGKFIKTYDIKNEPEQLSLREKIHKYLDATKHLCLGVPDSERI